MTIKKTDANQSSIINRLRFIGFLGFMVWLIMISNLFKIQLVRGEYYSKLALKQQQSERKLSSERGIIYDRNFKTLAVNLTSTSIYIDPKKIQNAHNISAQLSSITQKSYQKILEIITSAEGNFAWLFRKLSNETAQAIENADLPGVYSMSEVKRYYPQRENGGAVIGFTGIDNQGLGGLECKFEDILKGEEGIALFEQHARGGGHYCFDGVSYTRPQQGMSLRLTIDAFYQEIVQRELHAAYEKLGAKSCSMIIMDPKTGEILAMANEPTFDPNNGTSTNVNFHKNRVISDALEPGSTYKIVAAAAALEEHKLNTSDIVDCGDGEITIAGQTIHDYRPYKSLTFRHVIEKSSNIGVINIAQKLGQNKLYEYGRAFGFGMRTGINLPGENEGTYRTPDQWTKVSIASVSIGQEISATPLQVANAYCAIANKGVLMQPRIIREIIDAEGHVRESTSPQIIRQVASEATMDTLISMLVGVVERGTGVKAKIEGVTVAGKTGTAQKSDLVKGGYAPNKYVSSFAGFLPAENPQLVGLVVINEPKGLIYYGGDVAAPVFKRVMEKLICVKDALVPPSYKEKSFEKDRVPDVRGMPYDVAIQTLRKSGFIPEITGEGSIVIAQQHHPNTIAEIGSTVKLTLTRDADKVNVVGMPLRKAHSRLQNYGLDVVVKGSGIVRQQIKFADGRGYTLVCR